ncbi:hypothetical protein FULANO1_70 [Escherichia phage vB_EcoD_Fulano1]|uniref:Uncharacterized protein n=1 Tax=Escherichia phage vB_EcoD_Fulano1 TaxID=2902670 RepID=A0AC61TRE2_9CAUD|nr:hypothetical protein FULANO1_70 [Escherichia phage vB_EcoD_Fulano1]
MLKLKCGARYNGLTFNEGDKTMYIIKKMKCVSVNYCCAGMFKPSEIYTAQKLNLFT